mgnify:FL=1
MSLLYISQQSYNYITYFLVPTGIIGNGINIFIFIGDPTYRRTPCTFYFLVASVSNIIFIVLNSINRILNIIHDGDFISISNIWCKTRLFTSNYFIIISLTCSCLSSLDQFLVASRNVSVRRLSQIKRAHQLVAITIIISFLYGIPVFLFYNISPMEQNCIITNPHYAVYAAIHIIFFLCLIPITTMIVLDYLTYRNIRRTIALAKQHIDRQLVRMTFVQVILVIISFLPFGINATYTLITANIIKDDNQKMIETSILVIVTLTGTLFNTVCFLFKNKMMTRILLNVSRLAVMRS